MTAETIAKALGGRKTGGSWTARCPAHDDRTPSLSIRDGADGKLLVHCFAGCEQAAVLAALRDRGLWATDGRTPCPQPGQTERQQGEDTKRAARALRLWHQARPGAGTMVATYLRSRGILFNNWPTSLRFHPRCYRPKGDESNFLPPLPAMLGLVEHVQYGPIGVHATYLRPDGSGKAAIPKCQQRASFGPRRGAAVRFGIVRPDRWLVVAEGIETTLSVMQSCALPGWAALSEGGVRALRLPREAKLVLICADHDANGIGQRAAHDAADRFLREGRRVRIAMPPANIDFNGILNSVGMEALHAP